ncbi:MAG: calcium/sodium antiporter [Paludibacteraceae bacterium]|nr:calcium/sodium antiporter [Paludibacteraceae bacterium]
MKIALLLVGFVILIKGADYFVDGASSLAKRFNIPAFIVGLTICALGTSAPELAVSITAATSGSNSLAIGNVLGSNFFNLMVVLGVCAMINPIPVTKTLLRRDYPVSIAAMILLSIFLMSDADVSRLEAGILFSCLIGYIVWTIIDTKKHPEEADIEEDEDEPFVAWKCALWIIGGAMAIVWGGDLVVESAKYLGSSIGMNEKLIGFTICAIGTSLPELVTSYTASKKGQNDMAMGNVIGSNIFNILCILGISGMITPIAIGDANLNATLIDCGINMGVCILAYIFCLTDKKVERWEGGVLVSIYLAYMVYNIVKDLF